ncbi:MAG: hypothetical protein GY713_16980 [Actinomycetia bacterium]|nr:hypothetical protein [Actinomycetes bacterium]
MENRTAIAVSSGMVVAAALGVGVLIVAAGEPSPVASVGVTTSPPEVVVEYVDATGARIPLETSVAAVPASASTFEQDDYDDDEYEYEDEYDDDEDDDDD